MKQLSDKEYEELKRKSLIADSFAEGQIVEKLYCKDCNMATLTQEEVDMFEEAWSSYVDKCDCDKVEA